MPTAAASTGSRSSDARWQAVFARLMRTEGGYVDAADDHGGPTKYGVSLRFLAGEGKLNPALRAAYDVDHDGDLDRLDIRALTVAGAEALYRTCFWHRPGFDALPQPFDAALFDQGVNGSCRVAVKLLQRALNRFSRRALDADGSLGPMTLATLRSVLGGPDGPALLPELRMQAARRYTAIVADDPSQRRFIAGWLNRAEELGNV